jgi:hypothetical protein
MENVQHFLKVMIALMLASLACGSVEVGIVTPTSEENLIDSVDIQEPTSEELISTPEENIQLTEEATNVPTTENIWPETKPGVPDEVTLGPLGYGYPEVGLAVIEDQTVSISESPVEFGLLWDYSPVSGRLAYASEFFHGSEPPGNVWPNYSISDLWVYDYASGQSERWLSDYVNHALWSPDGERITASIFNPESNQLDLVLVSGPDQVETVAQCASGLFSWSPNGDRLAYIVPASLVTGMPKECTGTYLVSGMDRGEYQVERISNLGSEAVYNNFPGAPPFWAEAQNALIIPDTPFWVVPLDGSPPFVPQFPNGNGISLTDFMSPNLSLWNIEQRQLIIHDFGGRNGMGGVWVFELSADLRTIENYYRLGGPANDGNSDIMLVSWWKYGESILVADGDIPEPKPWINEFWAPPKVWSLIDQTWTVLKYQQ